MTERLSSLLHDRAADVDFDPVDLDLLTSTGDRRIRRRRYAGAAAGLAAVAAVSGLVVAVGLPGDDDAGPDVTVVPTMPAEPSYALGTTIHTPSGDVEVGHQVTAYVRTRVGYVTADPQGRIWSVLDGEVTQLGQTDDRDTELVADPDSSQVGWTDTSGDSPAFVVEDQATGDRRTLDVDTSGMDVLDDGADPASFYALSQGVAYVRTHDGAVAIDVESGEQRVVDADARNGFDVLGAYDGTVAFTFEDYRGIALGPRRGETPTIVGASDLSPEYLAFAPGGAHFLVNGDDQLAVFDTGTGDRVGFSVGAAYSGGFEWLDDDTLVALTVDEGPGDGGGPAVFALVTCTVSTTTCSPAGLDVPNLDAVDGFSFPGGVDYRDD